MLGRRRLGAAWEAVRAAAGGEGQAGLVGVYGPVPLGAVESTALEPDGRLAVTLAPAPARREPIGDVVVGRVGAERRLVRSDLPYPAGVRVARRAR